MDFNAGVGRDIRDCGCVAKEIRKGWIGIFAVLVVSEWLQRSVPLMFVSIILLLEFNCF